METNPKQLAASLNDHLLTRILPFWANNSIDRRCGGYITNLARDGSPGEGIQKYLVMQARMLDAFTAAHALDSRAGFLALADHGFQFIKNCMYIEDENRWVSVVECDGLPVSERIRAFDLTAAIHALSSYYAASGDSAAMDLALISLEQLQIFFWDDRHGGYYDSLNPEWKVDVTTKSLDVHLHAIEAFLALDISIPGSAGNEAAQRVLDLLIAKVGNQDLPPYERYQADWADESSDEEPVIKFGHQFKMIWLYLYAYRRTKRSDYLYFAQKYLSFVMTSGIDPQSGVYQAATADGEIIDARHCWWAQCEAIAALSRAADSIGNEDCLAMAARLIDYCYKHFHDASFGEWYAILSPQDEVIDSRKGHQKKSAYPIVRSLSAAVEDLKRIQ